VKLGFRELCEPETVVEPIPAALAHREGRRRNPTDWTYNNIPQTHLFDRGFTGHSLSRHEVDGKHLDNFDLINMNGRVYDPWLGRFLSPDPFVQAPTYSQNFNRYSYALNNPLKYTDPSGEFIPFFVVPNISWSAEGRFGLGLMVGIGFPGGLSAQVGVGYNFTNSNPYAFISSSYMFNSVYISYDGSSGFNAGYAAGLTLYSGSPISTNLLTVGANYNISHDYWSGNLSAMYVDNNGWTFNPSFSAMVFPEETTNFLRSGKFYDNDQMLKYYTRDGKYQQALDYFGFEGTYNPDLKSKKYQSENYWGATDKTTGEISYGNLAFEDYSTLYGTYIKESYSAHKIQSGLSIKKLPSDLQGLGMDTYLEEIYGYVYAYKRQGLFSGHNSPFNGVKFYQFQLDMFGVSYPTYPKYFSWIYKIPRRW